MVIDQTFPHLGFNEIILLPNKNELHYIKKWIQQVNKSICEQVRSFKGMFTKKFLWILSLRLLMNEYNNIGVEITYKIVKKNTDRIESYSVISRLKHAQSMLVILPCVISPTSFIPLVSHGTKFHSTQKTFTNISGSLNIVNFRCIV